MRRMSLSTFLVVRVLLDEDARRKYGLEICKATGLDSGSVYPILHRLEKIGWLESEWENIDPREYERPRRHFWRITPDGMVKAMAALEATRAALEPS